MKFSIASWVVLANAQYFQLNDKIVPPGYHALAAVARFFIYARDKQTVIHGNVSSNGEYIPPIGWGIWDKKYSLPAKIIAHDLGYTPSNSNYSISDNHHLQLAIMEYNTFWEKFIPYQQVNHFCCTQDDVDRHDCETKDTFFMPKNIRDQVYVTNIPISSSRKPARQVGDYFVPKTGIYFLLVVNCGQELPSGAFTGAVMGRGLHGYLSGIDVPKIQLYAVLTIIYSVIAIFWGLWSIRHKRQLIVLHHLIGMVISLGLIEQFTWLLHLSWANVVVPPSTTLTILSIAISVCKNVSTCLLVLVAALGLGITRPTLEKTTVAKLWVGVIFLGILEAMRQLGTHFHVSMDLSAVLLIVCILPITILYSSGFIWAFHSLNALIEELKNRRQTAKLRQMSRFRSALIFALICFVVSTIVETYILSMDIRTVWKYEWVFTDAVPSGLFLIILLVTSILWRPTRSSKYYSYNLQLPDQETGDSALDIDRIHADIHGKAFEVSFDSPPTTGLSEQKPTEMRAWGEIDLDMEDEPVPEQRGNKKR